VCLFARGVSASQFSKHAAESVALSHSLFALFPSIRHRIIGHALPKTQSWIIDTPISRMIPSAGLFLPETLHRREHPDSNHMESDITKLRYFQRKSGQPKLEAREAGMSLPSGLDEPPADTNIFSSIATAFHFADFVFTSSKASSESHVLACLIDRVRKDVSEASRLYLSPRIFSFLEAWPDKKSRIDTILIDVRQSLNDIGRYMETFRVAGDDGGAAGLKRKFEWIANHQKRLMNKQQLLSTCHQSLMTAINIMQTVELCGVTNGLWQDPIYEAPVQPWVKRESSHILRGPYSRREYRISQKNLSLSSMYLPQPDEDDVESTYKMKNLWLLMKLTPTKPDPSTLYLPNSLEALQMKSPTQMRLRSRDFRVTEMRTSAHPFVEAISQGRSIILQHMLRPRRRQSRAP
jgi:hypothetical protein